MRGSAYMDSNMGNLMIVLSLFLISAREKHPIFSMMLKLTMLSINFKNNQPTAVLMSIENYKQIKNYKNF